MLLKLVEQIKTVKHFNFVIAIGISFCIGRLKMASLERAILIASYNCCSIER